MIVHLGSNRPSLLFQEDVQVFSQHQNQAFDTERQSLMRVEMQEVDTPIMIR